MPPYFRHYEPVEPGLLHKLTAEQNELRKQIKLIPVPQPITTIAGCDSSFIGENILSVFVVLSFPELKELEVQYHLSHVTLPYIPGFLAFREVPNVQAAYQKLQIKPDVIMVDGHGIMHPRRLGIATHLGIKLQVPTLGVAKKKLVGSFQPVADKKGECSIVTHHGEKIGFALRSKEKVKPIFVSPGNLCDSSTALHLAMQTLRKHKLPEPTRLADKYSKELKQKI